MSKYTIIALIVLGLSLALNIYFMAHKCAKFDDSLIIQINSRNDSLRKLLDSSAVLLLNKPKEYTLIKNKYVKIHDTINTLTIVQQDSLSAKNYYRYINNRERYSVQRFK